MASENSKPVKKELESNNKSPVSKKLTTPKPKPVKKELKVKKEDNDDDDHLPLSRKNSSSKVVKEVKKKKKVKEEEKKKREKKVYDLPGQKRDTPEEKDPLRIFYESLYKQIPKSEMSQIWWVFHLGTYIGEGSN